MFLIDFAIPRLLEGRGGERRGKCSGARIAGCGVQELIDIVFE